MNDLKNFERETLENIDLQYKDEELRILSQAWINATGKYKYSYNWRWAGLPIIQFPTDIVATHEIIWQVKPTVIVETGIARGGSVLFNAAQLALVSLCEEGSVNTANCHRRVIGIDIDIRRHNRDLIESHGLSSMIQLIEGSSVSEKTFEAVQAEITPEDVVLVILDSNHTHEHVRLELKNFAPLVTVGSYVIVHDTGIENSPSHFWHNRDWKVGDNPMSAVREFLSNNSNFIVDRNVVDKMLISSSPDGYLKRIHS